MESANQKEFLEPVITDFVSSTTGIKFKKELLISELISLGNAKITPQIAELVGLDVESQIHRRRIQFLSTELISEMVAAKLDELGLIRLRKEPPHPATKTEKELFPEVLEVMAASENRGGAAVIPDRPRRVPVTLPGLKVLEEIGCVRDEKGELNETVEKLLRRVSRAIAEADAKYNPMANLEESEISFYNLLAEGAFLPEISILKNAGRALGTVLADTVLPLADTTDSIFETMKKTAAIRKQGGSVGISFSALRPKNDMVRSNANKSLGPVAFIKVFGEVMETVFHGHGEWAGLAVLHVNHPDIPEFLEGVSAPFRPCVGLTESFIKAVCEDDTFPLVNPRTGEISARVSARALLENIARGVKKGGLSLLFLDAIEALNPTPKEGCLAATGAGLGQPLLPFETLAAGHVNLARMVKEGEVDWEKLAATVRQAVHFLDNTLEINYPPFPETAAASSQTRKIGIGVMGFAELMAGLNGAVGEEVAAKVMSLIQKEALDASLLLARKRGFFPRFHESIFANQGLKRRHASLTFVSDSDEVSRIAGVTPGISFEKDPEKAFKVQAAFQKNTEMIAWQTLPLPANISHQDICLLILAASRMGLKGIRFKMEKPAQAHPQPVSKPEIVRPAPESGSYFHPEE